MESQAPKKDWFARNWKWFVPVVLLSIAVTCGLCVVGGAAGFLNLMKSNDVYQKGMEMVQQNARAQQLLGTPITAGLFVSGSIEETPNSGIADLSWPVSGPNGSGTVYAKGRKTEGSWVVTSLVLVLSDTGARVVIVGSD